jgi:hypothetical protein
VLPSDADPVVRGVTTAVGGPPGRHALLAEHRFWTPLRWLVLITLVTSLLGWWQKSPCRVHPWEEQYQYTRGCYTDVFALYFAERLDQGRLPYLEHPVEYPVVIGGVMTVAASAVSVLPAELRPRHFYDVTWALLTACALVVVVTSAKLAGRRPWDAALFAAAPLLVLHGTTNWDLVAMALAGTGLLLWARRRPVAAGGPARAGDGHQALPGAVPRPAARAVPAGPRAAGLRPHRRGAGAHPGAGQPAGLPGQPGLRDVGGTQTRSPARRWTGSAARGWPPSHRTRPSPVRTARRRPASTPRTASSS